MHRRTCLFSGRVQGVGFRYTVKCVSQQYDVNGYVRNLPDGRVELVAEGPDEEVDGLVQDVRQRMDRFIKDVTVEESPATGEFHGFAIRH